MNYRSAPVNQRKTERVPTLAETLREWAANHGRERVCFQWLLHETDLWVRNPHYVGSAQPHPDPDELQMKRAARVGLRVTAPEDEAPLQECDAGPF